MNNKCILIIISFSILMAGCNKEKKVIEIYETGDPSLYPNAINLLLSEEKVSKTESGKKILRNLKMDYLKYKKDQIKNRYSSTLISYIKHDILYISDLFGNSVKRIGNFRDCRDFIWSPDGKYIAYNNNFGKDVYIIDLVSNKRKKITYDEELSLTPSWSDDSQKIIYSLYNKVLEVDIKSLETNILFEVDEGYVLYPKYLSNNEIIYAHESKLKIYNVKTKAEKVLIFDNIRKKDVDVNVIHGRLMIIMNDNIFRLDPGRINMSLSFDKKFIQINTDIIDINNPRRERIIDKVAYNTSWAPDNQAILYTTGEEELFIKDLNESLDLEGLDHLIRSDISQVSWSFNNFLLDSLKNNENQY